MLKPKKAFLTREAASEELRRILDTNFNIFKHKVPNRVYYDKGYYYLTSKKSVYEYDKKFISRPISIGV